MSDFVIRKYNNADKLTILKLLDLNTPLFFEFSEKKIFENYLEKFSSDYYVLEGDDKEIIASGGINLYVDSTDSSRLAWDITHPDYQRKGFGSKLLRFRLNQIQTNPNVKTVFVRTSQFVYNFYKKEGFELILIEEDYWAKGYHLYKLAYTLKN